MQRNDSKLLKIPPSGKVNLKTKNVKNVALDNV